MKKIILYGLMGLVFLSACDKKDEEEDAGGQDDPGQITNEIPFDQLPASEAILTVGGTTTYVNVMENKRKSLPSFPNLKVKANKAIGYVKDTYGRPLKNASIGLSSSLVGGSSTPSFGYTNDKGYYEIEIPFGATYYYNAGYTVDFEGSRAALGLYPADGQMASFPGPDGTVENFVLLPYGQGDPDKVATEPHFANNYFGGCLSLSWSLKEGALPPSGSLPIGMVMEIKLTPLSLLHAAEKKTFIIRKTVQYSSLKILNLPLGKYKMEVSTTTNGKLVLQETGYNPREQQYGLFPKTGDNTTTSYTHITVPASADATRALPFRGGWESPGITVRLQ